MIMRELVNEFSWSKSRHGKFEECRRLYWFHYYGHWGGWKQNAPPDVREAYILKNLNSRQQWAGKIVHNCIAFALAITKNCSPPPLEALIDRAHSQMREDFRLSRKGEYRNRPKKVVGLIEHEFNWLVSDSEWKANWETVERCLRRFYSMPWLTIASRLPSESWLPIDEIGSFFLDGIKVYAGPDFAFYNENKQIVLIDWKTGVPRNEDYEQVQAYALFAEATWNSPVSQVSPRLVYLGLGEEVAVPLDDHALQKFREHFRKSVAQMKALLRDPETNHAVREDFERSSSPEYCQNCAFQRLCRST